MADTNPAEERAPLTIMAREVNRVVIGHKMGAMEWMRLSDEEKQGLIATVRAGAVAQMTKAYPGHLYTFLEPKVEKDGTGLTVAGDRTLDRGITISCPVFVFEPVMGDDVASAVAASAHGMTRIDPASSGYGFIGYCSCGAALPGSNHREVYSALDAHQAAELKNSSR